MPDTIFLKVPGTFLIVFFHKNIYHFYVKIKFFLFLLFLLIILSIKTLSGQNLPIRTYFTDDGLASSQVWSITEDRNGILWFGCASGISRFNGFKFKNFRLKEGLPSESITKILSTKNGYVVALTLRGLVYHKEFSNKFIPIKNIGEISDFTIKDGINCEIFSIVRKKGLYKYSLTSGKWIPLGYKELKGKAISFIEDNILLSSENGNLYIIYTKFNHIKKLGKIEPISKIKKFSPKKYLLISEHSIYLLYLYKFQIKKIFSTQKDGTIIFDALFDNTKNLWIATNHGLIEKSKNKIKLFTNENGVPGIRVLSTFQTSENILWFGTNHGLFKLVTQDMLVYKKLAEINPGSYICFYWDENKKSMLVGTTAGVFKINEEKIEKFNNNYLSRFPIWDIEKDRDGNFFFASEGGGLIEVKKNGQTKLFTKENKCLPDNNVTDILLKKNKIFVACKKGFSVQNNGKWKIFTIKNGLPASYVRCILETHDGNILLGTIGAGIVKFKNGIFYKLESCQNLKEIKAIYDLLEYKKSLFAATNYGLFEINKNRKIKFFSTESGLLPYGLSVLFPIKNYLWIGSDGGAMLFDLKKEKVIKILTKDDGLPGNEFTTHNAIAKDSYNNIWFGLFGGIAKISNMGLLNIQNSKLNPKIIISEISYYSNGEIHILKNIRKKRIIFPHNAKEIKIKFEVVWFRNEYSLKIEYKLKGVNKKWEPIRNFKNMEIYFTSLPFGNHPLYLKIFSIYSKRNITKKIIEIRIETPWWKKSKYLGLIFITIILFLGLINITITNLKTKKLKKEKEKLNRLVEERTKQLEILNKKLKEKNKILKEMSEHDYLTNLYNRRHFINSLKLLKNISKREKSLEVCFIMIDIDNFKKLNDTYGHAIGDKVLIETSKILRKNLRESDLIARYGGEEFIIALLKTGKENCLKVAEKLRKLIEENEIETEKGKVRITISGGISSINLKGKTFDEIEKAIKLADENLYKAKESGKNKIFNF